MADITGEGVVPPIVVTEPPKFDLESYIANYDGLTRLLRLIVIGVSSTYLRNEALRAALTEAKLGKDVEQYTRVVQVIQKLLPGDPAGKVDAEWVETTTKRVKAEAERLESELKGYKNNLIKESIRMGNEDLGAFYYDIGDYTSSLKAYTRMRDYCTTPKHISEMSQRLILVGVAEHNWLSIQSNIVKIRVLSLRPEDKAKILAGLAPCYGLAQMCRREYKDAALSFLESDPSFLTLDPTAGVQMRRQVLSPNDVAVYGGLCALATMDRGELQASVLGNADFRNFLELEPHIRRAISNFCNSKYTACLDILESYRPDYLLDLYLQQHVARLYSDIRRKSIVQYFRPFSRVSLAVMAEAFKTTESEMETELVDMISSGMLDARLDLVGRMLLATVRDSRCAVHARALEMAQQHERALRLKLLKINMQNAGLEVKAVKHNIGDGKGGAGSRKMKGPMHY